MLNNLLTLCDLFLEDIGDFESVELGLDFSCFPTTNEISISVLASQNSVREFTDNLHSRTNINDISEFTWSLLHEVGHCMTWNMMNDRTINHCRNIKRKINRGSLPTATYYTLTDERIATDWAIRYATANHKAVKAFDNMALQLLTEFYLENDLED